MFCSNCGHQLNDNDIFCPVCGAKNAAAENKNEQQAGNTQPNDSYAQYNTSNDMGQYQQSYTYTNAASADVPPKKKSKFLKIGIPVGAAVIVLGSVVTLAATGFLPHWFRKSFSSPENYFEYVAEKNTDSALTSISNSYAAYTEQLQQSTNLNSSIKCSVTLGTPLRNLAGLIDPALGDLENASVQLDINQDTDIIKAQILANVNSADIATVNLYADIANEEGYLQIPELSDSYLDLSSELTDASQSLYYSNEIMGEVQDYLPDEDTLNALLKRYSDICWNNMTDVEKSSKTLEAKGVEQKCTALTINLDGEYAYNTMEDILNELIDDQDIKEIITNIDPDSYDEFKSSVEDATDRLPDTKDDLLNADANVEIIVYLDNQDEICGIEINAAIDNQECDINYLMPQDGSKFGYLCNVVYEGKEYFNVSGSGTIKNDILDGDFSVSLDSSMNPDEDIFTTTENILLFTISDCDLKAAKEGHFDGKMIFSTEAVSQITDYSLAVTIKSDDDNASIEAALLSGSEEWLTLTIEASKAKELPDFLPSDSDTCYDIAKDEEMQKYIDELDLETFINDLSERTGITLETDDILNAIEDITKDFSYDYDDSDWDYNDNPSSEYNNDSNNNDESEDELDNILNNLDDSIYSDSTDGASKIYGSIDEFVTSDYMQNMLNAVKSNIPEDMMSLDLHADGDKMIYTFKYTTIENTEGLADALKEGLNSMSSVFQNCANALKSCVSVENPVVVLEYLDKNGTLIYSQEFTGAS